jgi:hypothetical protein
VHKVPRGAPIAAAMGTECWNNAASTNGAEEIVVMRRNDGDAVARDGEVIGNAYVIDALSHI